MEYGTLAWARRTAGELTGAQRIRQTVLLASYQVTSRFRRTARQAGFGTAQEAERALAETDLPRTRAVDAALGLIDQLGPPALVGHAVRTYAFGTLFGLRDGLRWDREVFALASVLHDLALARRDHGHTCFAHDGAEQALTVLAESDVDLVRRERVADAICLHLRVNVPVSLGVEAHLVHAGAALDVVGSRRADLGRVAVTSVLRRYPRLDLVELLSAVFAEERRRHPTARVSRWMAMGFDGFIRHNPLDRG
jgi:hypothetical protein